MSMEHEKDIEPEAVVQREEAKLENINDALKNVIKKSMAADGKFIAV